MSVPSEPGQPSTVELISQLSAQTTRLVRDELAQKELQESVRHAGIGAAVHPRGGGARLRARQRRPAGDVAGVVSCKDGPLTSRRQRTR